MLGVEAIPALVYSVIIFKVPKSPRWLIAKKMDLEGARTILSRTDPEGAEVAIKLAIEEAKELRGAVGVSTLFRGKFRKISFMAILIAFFNQMSGINAIIYFAPRIFESAGISTEDALVSTVGIGLMIVIATMVELFLIDRIGERSTLLPNP